MSKSEPVKDGFYSKIFVSTIVVIWVSLVGGNWLGHYIVEKQWLVKDKDKNKSAKFEYKAMANQKPKPWVTVDPRQVEAVEAMTGQKNTFPATTPTPDDGATPDDIITSTPSEFDDSPVPQVSDTPQPVKKKVKETPLPKPTSALSDEPTPAAGEVPAPTPMGNEKYQLQFGSFSTKENAETMVEELGQKGQPAQVEEIPTGHTKVFRVRGGSYSEEEARLQRDKLKEMQIDAYIVNKS